MRQFEQEEREATEVTKSTAGQVSFEGILRLLCYLPLKIRPCRLAVNILSVSVSSVSM